MVKTDDVQSSYEASFFWKRWDGWFLILASASQGFRWIFEDLHLNSVITVKIESGLLSMELFYNFYGIRDLLCELRGTNYQLFRHQLCSLCELVFNWSGQFTNVDSQIIEIQGKLNDGKERREEKETKSWVTVKHSNTTGFTWTKSNWNLGGVIIKKKKKIKYSPSACLGQHI